MGGINFANVKAVMGLPDLDDMDYDPEGTYQQLTGHAKAGATSPGDHGPAGYERYRLRGRLHGQPYGAGGQ